MWQPFSNIFRYALLYELGGWWIDTDVVFVGKRVPALPIAFAQQEPGLFNNGQLKFPPKHPAVKELLQRAVAIGTDQQRWGQMGPHLITDVISARKLEGHAVHTNLFYPLHWLETYKFWLPGYVNEIKARTRSGFCLHLWTSMFAKMNIPLDLKPPTGSYLALLYTKYPFHSALREPVQSEYAKVLQSINTYISQDWVEPAARQLGITIEKPDSSWAEDT
jgi:hypothetical protein